MYFVNFFQRGHQGINCILVREIWSGLRKLAETIWGTSSPKTKALLYYYIYRVFKKFGPIQKNRNWKLSVFLGLLFYTQCLLLHTYLKWKQRWNGLSPTLLSYLLDQVLFLCDIIVLVVRIWEFLMFFQNFWHCIRLESYKTWENLTFWL